MVHDVRITRRLTIVLLACLPLLGGCPAGRGLAYVLFGGETRKVPAEFEGLADQRVAVVVWCDRRVLYDYPDAPLTLSLAIADEIGRKVDGVRVVEPRRVVRYQDDNIYWEEMGKAELGKALGADYLLFVPVEEFATREPGSMNLFRGRISAVPSLYDVAQPERSCRAWKGGRIRTVYPEHAPTGVLRETAREVRLQAEQLFAEELAKKFYDHEEPLE